MKIGLFRWWQHQPKRVLVIDTNILLEQTEELVKLPDQICIPWAVLKETQQFYWQALWRKTQNEPAKNVQERDRDEKALKSWPTAYQMIRKGKWELVGSKDTRIVPKIFKNICPLNRAELLVWLDVIGPDIRNQHDVWEAFERIQDIYWEAIRKIKITGQLIDEIEAVIRKGWLIIRYKMLNDKGKWWLDAGNSIKKQLLEIFNPLGIADIRILAATLVLKKKNEEVYLVTKDRRLLQTASHTYGINVIKTVKY